MESDSDNESPEVISTNKMKTEREREIMDMFLQKRKTRDQLKLKRKLKAEKLATQKKEKQARQKELLQHAQEEEDGNEEDHLDLLADEHPADASKKGQSEKLLLENPVISSSLQIAEDDDVAQRNGKRTKTTSRKFYPKYNIEVDPLTKISNPRAISALNFRERRMAKVHREQVASTLISYGEKMQVKNT